MSLNQNFIKILLEETANNSKRIFLCRYGARSLDACNLALANGVDNCYNIIDGFDGNQFGPGWQVAGLPVE
jgi:rhodanese-related sulfurtransferase